MLDEVKAFARHSATYGVAEFLKKGIGFLLIPLYTRYLMPSDYGILELLDLTLNVLGMIVGLQIGEAIIRFYHYFDDQAEKQEVFTTTLIAGTCLSLCVLIVLLIGSRQTASIVAGDKALYPAFQIVFVCLAIQNTYLIGENLFLAQKKSVLYSALSIVTLVVSLSLNILFLVVFGLGIYGILWSMLIAKSLNLALVLPITLRNMKLRFSWTVLKQMIIYSYPLILVALAQFATHFSDRFFIRHYCDISELGIYSLGYKFGMIISILVVGPLSRIWNIQRFEIAKKNDSEPMFARMFTFFVAIVSFVALGVSVFIDEVLFVMATPAYHSASSVVPLIAGGYVLFGVATFMTLGCMVSGRTGYLAVIQAIAAGLNILFNYLLIDRYGIMGAALSTTLTFCCLAIMNFVSSQKTLFVHYEYGNLAKLFILALLIYGVSQWAEMPFLMLLGFKGFLILCFPAGLLCLGFLNREERGKAVELLREICQKIGGKLGGEIPRLGR